MHREQRALHVDIEELVEMRLGDGAQGGELAQTGVGEDDVDPLALRLDRLVEAIEVSQLGDVALDAGDVVADGLHGVVKLLLAPSRDEDVGALFDKELRRGQADPFGGASDNGHFSLQLAHMGYSCSWSRQGRAHRAGPV